MSSKKKNIFNPDFVFEDTSPFNSDLNGNSEVKKSKNKPKILSIKDDLESNNNVDEINDELINKKDQVKIKTSSVKKRKLEENEFFDESAKIKVKNAFDDMGISKSLMKALSQLGFQIPTQIQASVIPTALMGKDICACAVTGSGKTLGFMLPTLERLLYKPKYPQVTRVLILTPTRELAAQICKVTRDLAQYTNIQSCLCAGGFDIKTQEAALRLGPDICIATPGRLIDHLHNTPSFNLETVEILILDEADRMLDENFAEQLKEIMRLCSKTRQTMLFSATMTDKVDDLARLSLNKPVKIFINENVDVTPDLKQEFIRIRDNSELHKKAVLASLITRKFNERVIVFVKTKVDCHRLCLLLNLLNIEAAELHGSLSQTQRLEKLNEFQEQKLNVLVATDLASRGLDIADVKTVINYAMPMSFKHYIHRVGRTARAGKSGRSISLVTENDRWLVKDILKSSKAPVKSRVIPAEVINAYKERIEALNEKYHEILEEEKAEKMIDKMEKQVHKAEDIVKNGSKKNGKKNDKKNLVKQKRVWLENVDYKTGALKSELKKKKLEEIENKKKAKKKKLDGGSEDEFSDEEDVDNDDEYDDHGDYDNDNNDQKANQKKFNKNKFKNKNFSKKRFNNKKRR